MPHLKTTLAELTVVKGCTAAANPYNSGLRFRF